MEPSERASAPSTGRPTWRRSVDLLRAFTHEQSDPPRFYEALAEDSAVQLGRHVDLDGALLLDVGGGPGYFRDAFERAGASYLALDADAGELAGLGEVGPGTVIGSGMALPFADGCVDVCYSSNVLEHVPSPWAMADEMVRVTRPGGTVFVSFTCWWGPWGGHETAPWHVLGGRRARARYARRHGHEPKNRYGESLFAVRVGDALRWARSTEHADLVAMLPRYNPRGTHWLTRVPVVREVVTWNLVWSSGPGDPSGGRGDRGARAGRVGRVGPRRSSDAPRGPGGACGCWPWRRDSRRSRSRSSRGS